MKTEKKPNGIRITGLILGFLSSGLMFVCLSTAAVVVEKGTVSHIAGFLLLKFFGSILGMCSGFSISEGSNRGRLVFLSVYPILIVFPLIFIPITDVYPLFILDIIFYLIFCLILTRPGTKEGLKELMWNRIRQSDNVVGYQKFFSQYPDDAHCEEAKKRIEQIKKEQQLVQEAVTKILPQAVNGKVQFSGNSIHISAHLLNSYSPDDHNPTVKGAYGSHSALTDYVKRRTAEIYKAVFRSAATLTINDVVVECRHGVRHIVIGGGSGGGDYATTLYKTTLKGESAKKLNWAAIANEAIEKAWTVSLDIIYTLDFRPF